MGGVELLTLTNPVFRGYAFYGTIVILKMMVMSFMTTARRFQQGSFANPEDMGKKKVVVNEAVERVRRNHLNDLENIPAFLFLGLLYIMTKPTASIAIWHFRIFASARILHTIIYQVGLQPWRVISFTFGVLVCLSMAYQIIVSSM